MIAVSFGSICVGLIDTLPAGQKMNIDYLAPSIFPAVAEFVYPDGRKKAQR
jgi:hypothetical protein